MDYVENITHSENAFDLSIVTPMERARAYVQNRVQRPALASDLPDSVKSKVRHSDLWLEKFKRVGDLLIYLKRFEIDRNDPIYKEMKKFGLLTFEDIVGEFEKEFQHWTLDCSRITDFVIGERYSVFDILILARNYDTRSGGMFVLNIDETPTAVIIKANLSGGPYPNKWIDEPKILKYYLKSISGVFGEHFKPNRAIIENKNIPIVTFTRLSDAEQYVFRGIFNYKNILREADGTKSFVLERKSVEKFELYEDSVYVSKNLGVAVNCSLNESRELRLSRLAAARKYPRKITITSSSFERNPDVIAEVLFRASGICESCEKPAPFLRLSDGTPYLEVHHRLPLSMGGEDTIANALALCPNCHRQSHYGPGDLVTPISGNDDLTEKI